MQIHDYTALQLGEMIRSRKLGCAEVTKHYLGVIGATNPALNACLHINGQTLAHAERVQKRIDGGEDISPLAGVPFTIKDNICTRDMPTTCASKMLHGYTPAYDAAAYTRLLQAGAIPIAKNNLDEFAMGGSTRTSYYGPARNPWDTSRVPGGSSGGTAAAVAAGQAPFGLGSDTGGSIRQPCAFCGISGIKPTYGRVSRYGLVAYASSMDAIGPMGRDVQDCAAVLALVQGADGRDATAVNAPPLDMADIAQADIRGMKIGIPANWLNGGLDADIRLHMMQAAQVLESEGARLVDITLHTEHAVAAYIAIACAEASSNLSRFDGVRYGHSPQQAGSLNELYTIARTEGFGDEVKRRIMIGAYMLSANGGEYYAKAVNARRQITEAFAHAFTQCDAILAPAAPTIAYKLDGSSTAGTGTNDDSHADSEKPDPFDVFNGDRFTSPANLAGLPAVALPCGFSQGMPVGMQLIGNRFCEQDILRIAHRFQLCTAHHRAVPKGVGA